MHYQKMLVYLVAQILWMWTHLIPPQWFVNFTLQSYQKGLWGWENSPLHLGDTSFSAILITTLKLELYLSQQNLWSDFLKVTVLLILRKHLASTPRPNNHLSFGLLFILLSKDGIYGKPNNDSVVAGNLFIFPHAAKETWQIYFS